MKGSRRLVHIVKIAKKDNLRECKNSRGITVLSVVSEDIRQDYRLDKEMSRKEQALGKAGEQDTRSSFCVISSNSQTNGKVPCI